MLPPLGSDCVHLGGCRLSVSLCCTFQSPQAPQEASEQPASPTSSCGGCQSSLAQEAPTASQGLLKLFQRNAPVEDLGAKGVSPERGSIATPGPRVGGRASLRFCARHRQCRPYGPQASAERPVCLLPEVGAVLSAA